MLLTMVPPARGAADSVRVRASAIAPVAATAPEPPPTQDDGVSWGHEVASGAGWLWRSLTTGFDSVVRAFSPPSPGDIARQIERRDSELWSLLEDAGYTLREVRSTMGIVPSAEASFQMMRELSLADREQLAWRLEQYALRDHGLAAHFQRSVIQTLLDASETGSHKIDVVDISLWPVPGARFSLVPAINVLSGDHQTLMRQLDGASKERQSPAH